YDVLFLPLAVVPLALVIDRARAQADRAGLACLALLLLLTAWLLAQQLLFGWSTKAWSLNRVWTVLSTSALWALPALLLVPLWRAWDVRRATPWLAGIALSLLLINNGWEGTQKGHPFNASAQARVDFIRAYSQPSDTLWVDGNAPQYYLWTERRPAAAYLFFSNVTPNFDVKARVLAALSRTPPAFIIAKPERVGAGLASAVPSEAAYYRFIAHHYQPVSLPALGSTPSGLYQRQVAALPAGDQP
ncbi:MAG: hypothetical protein ACRCYV_06455, partial [Aeromonas sp.]